MNVMEKNFTVSVFQLKQRHSVIPQMKEWKWDGSHKIMNTTMLF